MVRLGGRIMVDAQRMLFQAGVYTGEDEHVLACWQDPSDPEGGQFYVKLNYRQARHIAVRLAEMAAEIDRWHQMQAQVS